MCACLCQQLSEKRPCRVPKRPGVSYEMFRGQEKDCVKHSIDVEKNRSLVRGLFAWLKKKLEGEKIAYRSRKQDRPSARSGKRRIGVEKRETDFKTCLLLSCPSAVKEPKTARMYGGLKRSDAKRRVAMRGRTPMLTVESWMRLKHLSVHPQGPTLLGDATGHSHVGVEQVEAGTTAF